MKIPRRREVVIPVVENERKDLEKEFLSRFMNKANVTEFDTIPSDIQKAINESISALHVQFEKKITNAKTVSVFLKREKQWLNSTQWLNTSVCLYLRREKPQHYENKNQRNDVSDEKLTKGKEKCKEAFLPSKVSLKQTTSRRGRRVYKSEVNEKSDTDDDFEPSKTKKSKNSDTDEDFEPSKTKKPRLVSQSLGRRPKEWTKLKSRRQKERRWHEGHLKTCSSDNLLKAAARIALRDGLDGLASAIKQASEMEKYKNINPNNKKTIEPIIPFSPEEAVILAIENNIPKRTYTELHFSAKSKRANIYPSHKIMNDARIACYPTGIQVIQNVSEVPLQNLLNHTAARILQIEKNNLPKCNLDGKVRVMLNVKWGYDGSSGFSEWRQRFLTHSIKDSSEADLFCTSLVPLYLKSNDTVIWKNPIPSSVRYCRPLTLQLGNETQELTRGAQEKVEHQIQHLKPYSTSIHLEEAEKSKETELHDDMENEHKVVSKNLCTVEVYFHVQQTIVDPGTETDMLLTPSLIDCNICASKPDAFDQEKLNASATAPILNPDLQRYIFSPLHAWVCCFEFLVNLACFNPKSRHIVNATQRKADIQKCFRTELNVIMGKPRNGCNVSTADAKNATKAFHLEKDFARITGLDMNIIHKFNVILKTLSCEYEINIEEFDKFCQETGELLKKLYSWCTIPSVIHKLLWHGKMMATEVILPIGMMSNEAQKARNKGYKPFFLRHSRKDAKEHAMTDVIKHLMVLGDPIMTKHSILVRKQSQNWHCLERDMVELLEIRKSIELKPKKEISKEKDISVEDINEEQNSSNNLFEASDSHYDNQEDTAKFHQYTPHDKGRGTIEAISNDNTNVYQNSNVLVSNFHSHTPTNYSLSQPIPGLHYVHGSNISMHNNEQIQVRLNYNFPH